jgi:DNA-binding HxlR family transcriptional regulator
MIDMRSYNQYCGLAKALDAVGDRWTLLIIRELLLRGSSRYTDLQGGLPGIATNLLADRLKHLETLGVVHREEAASPAATALFSLTDWGKELKPIILALGLWAAPVMLGQARPRDEFRGYWLALPLESCLTDRTPSRRAITIELRMAGGPMVVETTGGGVRVRPGSATRPNAVLSGPPAVVFNLLVARIDLPTARARRLRFEGDVAALRRVQPQPPRRSGENGAARSHYTVAS